MATERNVRKGKRKKRKEGKMKRRETKMDGESGEEEGQCAPHRRAVKVDAATGRAARRITRAAIPRCACKVGRQGEGKKEERGL